MGERIYCRDCKARNLDSGSCHRNPPTVIPGEGWWHPFVMPDDWCLDAVPRDDTAQQASVEESEILAAKDAVAQALANHEIEHTHYPLYPERKEEGETLPKRRAGSWAKNIYIATKDRGIYFRW